MSKRGPVHAHRHHIPLGIRDRLLTTTQSSPPSMRSEPDGSRRQDSYQMTYFKCINYHIIDSNLVMQFVFINQLQGFAPNLSATLYREPHSIKCGRFEVESRFFRIDIASIKSLLSLIKHHKPAILQFKKYNSISSNRSKFLSKY